MKDSSLRVFTAVIAASFLINSQAVAGYGGHYFRSLRQDQTIPQQCLDLELNHFEQEELDLFTYSIVGGKRRGFDHEYPMARRQAKDLWRYIKRFMDGGTVDTGSGKFAKDPELKQNFDILINNYEAKDFSFGSEGEILELLVINALEQELNSDLYVYGSVQYQDRSAGELDLIVARKSDCSVFSIGEVKLGVKSLGKAKKQLNRFYGFLRSHVRNGLKAISIVK
jgi:hypothetical protein